jgi:DNA-binding response OmpR family regulator
MTRARILVVDDDEDVRELVGTVLERGGMETVRAKDGHEALRSFYKHRPDSIVLDVAMPGLDGWAVLERIREVSDVPILMLTARADELEKVRGLRGGADDYLTKPFGRQEFIARVEALLRRGREHPAMPERYSDTRLEVDFEQRSARVEGEEVDLSPLEFGLLAAFVQHPGQVLTHDQLLELVWNNALGASKNQLKLYVGYLRRKLDVDGAGDMIETVRGFGYRFRPADPTLRST